MKPHWLIIETNLVGLLGVTIVLYTYLMLQIGKMSKDSIWFSLLNAMGSILILFSLYFHWNFPSVIIEIVWLSISIYGFIKSIYPKRTQQQPD